MQQTAYHLYSSIHWALQCKKILAVDPVEAFFVVLRPTDSSNISTRRSYTLFIIRYKAALLASSMSTPSISSSISSVFSR
mmetsp:Transcript_29138/g.45289  ORF Transcript_29138/g.45289 Transcript_29138/m.45289 type:complete len:80 (+) Transcript_29138:3048-3287(+)